MIPGHATAEGTSRYASRFPDKQSAGFYREAAGLLVSSLGLGTYLGNADEPTDESYAQAVKTAALNGINFFDTAINYRQQRSELALGQALHTMFNALELQRDEVMVATKAGFLTPDAVPEFLAPEDVVGRMHSMAPDFLADQIDRSRANLRLDAIDVFYLHNPETQLNFVSRTVFNDRLRLAFARLEKLASEHVICSYGMATWDGFRKSGSLDLESIVEMAREEGGEHHRFRFIQLPLNLGMVEAFVAKPENPLEVALRHGITVVASATLLQARLLSQIPEAVADLLPGLHSEAQRAIQFTRSTPGITVALVGMSTPAHVTDNLGVAAVPPATRDQYLRLYQ